MCTCVGVCVRMGIVFNSHITGNTSILLNIRAGHFYIIQTSSARFLPIDLNVYKYFEFYVKSAPGFGEAKISGKYNIALQVKYRYNINSVLILIQYLYYSSINN